MLLEVVPLAGNIGNNFTLIDQAHLGHTTQSRVRLLWGRRIDTRANTALLRVGLHRRNLVPLRLGLPGLADQLINGRHIARTLFSSVQTKTCST
ncbi:hypothetical protein KKY_1677 [Pelagibacterium halotolerans B2]|uniref:Uncharacterized protein n=1 Tax=Pelagibacterium halotolerans (strain DSM 22347 / JCM 15775 / CGMCC 1.7692 / B2) TaxID=1082931 RepID=G4RC46_PELHB|nr:hypothetical protein KKY_1677 [Pelagibacterium halotolerans B2]